MKFSLNFIREFLNIEVSPKKLANLLTMAGMEVESVETAGDDYIFEIEVTTNRYDWLSMIGIAHEVSAVLGKTLNFKYPKILEKPLFNAPKIKIEDKADCPYYIGRIIKNVKVSASPFWLKQRVLNCGISSVNDIVDITNYCMLKWGNPLHAFDCDKIEGDIYIRRAKNKEVFFGIDDKERILGPQNLVITDSKKIIAIAGVIGAKNTEVDNNTKNIFLEAAIFSPITVRRSSRACGFASESSYRFERTVFGYHLECASSEAASLIAKTTNGNCAGFQRSGRKQRSRPAKITIDVRELNSYLGTSVSQKELRSSLLNLGFSLGKISKDKVRVVAPSFRLDINREVDIYEEFARVYGYEKIPSAIPFLNCSNKNIKQKVTPSFKSQLRACVALLGFKEIITYSMEEDKEQCQANPSEIIKIVNPLRVQENSLRVNLLVGMLKSLRHNLNRGASGLSFFELADIYLKEKNRFRESPVIALAMSGDQDRFFTLKRAVEEIMVYLGVERINFHEKTFMSFENSLSLESGKENLGFLGKLNQKERKIFGLKEDIFFAQIDLSSLSKVACKIKYKSFSVYPPVFRDISLALQKNVKFKEIEKIIRDTGKYLKDLRIVDAYQGKDIPKDAKAFTLRIFYQAREKTLTAHEVDSFHSDIRQKLSNQKGIHLR